MITNLADDSEWMRVLGYQAPNRRTVACLDKALGSKIDQLLGRRLNNCKLKKLQRLS